MIVVCVPLAAVLLCSVACATVQPLREPAQFISQKSPEVVWVTYKNRSIMGVAQPRVSGDSLFGTVQGAAYQPVAVPLSQVERIEAVVPDRKRTTLLVAGLTAFTVVGVYALIQGGTGGSCSPFDERPEDC